MLALRVDYNWIKNELSDAPAQSAVNDDQVSLLARASHDSFVFICHCWIIDGLFSVVSQCNIFWLRRRHAEAEAGAESAIDFALKYSFEGIEIKFAYRNWLKMHFDSRIMLDMIWKFWFLWCRLKFRINYSERERSQCSLNFKQANASPR